jgi:hypothetical protein
MPYEDGFSGECLTVFDHLKKHGNPFFFHGAPEFDCRANEVVDRALLEIDGEDRFLFLFISDLDPVGHVYGPESIERYQASQNVDRALEEIWNHLRNFYNNIDFIVFGDHGMVPVTQNLDFRPIIRELPLRPGVDYLYFLDSTFARFWYFNEKAKDIIQDVLIGLSGGKLIITDERQKYRIRYSNRKFGDLIYWLDGGKMIFPNFWHVRNKKKGMHGYRREEVDNHASFVLHSTSHQWGYSINQIEMVDVFQTVMMSLGMEIPDGTYGKPVQVIIK